MESRPCPCSRSLRHRGIALSRHPWCRRSRRCGSRSSPRLRQCRASRPLQEALLEAFPYMEQERVQEVSLVAGPAGPAGGASAASVTWKLTNDAGTLVVIGAGSATLSAGASYTTVEALSRQTSTHAAGPWSRWVCGVVTVWGPVPLVGLGSPGRGPLVASLVQTRTARLGGLRDRR